jgi:hypothetical protein
MKNVATHLDRPFISQTALVSLSDSIKTKKAAKIAT